MTYLIELFCKNCKKSKGEWSPKAHMYSEINKAEACDQCRWGLMTEHIRAFTDKATVKFLLKELDKAIAEVNDPYVDSQRLAIKDDTFSETLYREAYTCCGSQDIEISYHKKVFKIGFNYGH